MAVQSESASAVMMDGEQNGSGTMQYSHSGSERSKDTL